MQPHANDQPERIAQWAGSYLPLLLIMILALALQIYGLESKSLWHDELGTLTNSSPNGSWLDVVRNPLTIPTIPKPPLYFAVIHLFLAVDSSVFAVRLPSLIFALLTIPILYIVGKAIFDRQVGLLAAFLLAISPLQIRYAQEARMYSMLTFFSLLSLYLFWRAIRTRDIRWWLGFCLATALNLYTFQFALLSLGVMILFALWLLLRTRSRPDLRRQFPFRGWHFCMAVGLSGLLYSPMVPFLIEGILSAEGFGGLSGAPYGELRWSLDSLIGTLRLFSSANTAGLAIYACLFVLALVVLLVKLFDLPGGFAARMKEAAASLSLAPDGENQSGWQLRTRYGVLFFLMWLVLPLVILLSIPSGHGVRIRYILFLLPVYLLFVAYGLRVASQWLVSWLVSMFKPTLSQRWATTLVTVAMVGLLAVIGAPSVAAYYVEEKQNWRDSFALVQSSAQPGEVLFVSRLHHQTGAIFYGSLRTDGPDLLTADNVKILPKEPGEELLPAETDRGWLVVPVREEYLPGGALDAKLKPYYQLTEPDILSPSNVPQDSELIGPITYRSTAVMQIVRIRQPTIHFTADDESIHRGECTWLRWQVENVREVYLDGQGVVGRGEREVCPADSTAYELEVIHADGSNSRETIEIVVLSP
jgi:mannosyltransferase